MTTTTAADGTTFTNHPCFGHRHCDDGRRLLAARTSSESALCRIIALIIRHGRLVWRPEV
ncbi:hypothetical protein ACVBEQ_19880 [Nakamurella sp. GG22]